MVHQLEYPRSLPTPFLVHINGIVHPAILRIDIRQALVRLHLETAFVRVVWVELWVAVPLEDSLRLLVELHGFVGDGIVGVFILPMKQRLPIRQLQLKALQ